MMNIEIDDNLFYDLKDVFMVKFLLTDMDTIYKMEQGYCHKDDLKQNKKLKKSYKTILKYYGVDNG